MAVQSWTVNDRSCILIYQSRVFLFTEIVYSYLPKSCIPIYRNRVFLFANYDVLLFTDYKKPRIRLIAEMLYWIAGIVVGIALIWQTFFHNIFKNEPKNSSDTIHILQKDT